MPVEQHVPGVVVAVGAERLPDVRVVMLVDGVAPQRFSMGAMRFAGFCWVAGAMWLPSVDITGVDLAEAGGGQGGEYLGSGGGVLGHAVVATVGARASGMGVAKASW